MTRSSEDSEVLEKRPTRKREVGESVAPRRIISSARRVATPPKKIEPEEPTIMQSRKAPTPLAADLVAHTEKKRQFIIVMILLGIGIGASAGVGFLDKGQINVEQTIEARNERIRNNQADERDVLVSQVEVPVQDTALQGKVDGGLVGRGTGGLAPEVEGVASSTATSTDMTASSTETMASSTEADAETARPEDAPSETIEEVTP